MNSRDRNPPSRRNRLATCSNTPTSTPTCGRSSACPRPRLVHDLVQDQLGVLVAQLDHVQSLAAHWHLCILICDLFQLAGEIFFDGDRYTDAAYCYALAASAGREA